MFIPSDVGQHQNEEIGACKKVATA